MDLESQFDHGELLLSERRCRVCGGVKNLIGEFYITHKNSTHLPSSYSYECRACTIKRIQLGRRQDNGSWCYPDW